MRRTVVAVVALVLATASPAVAMTGEHAPPGVTRITNQYLDLYAQVKSDTAWTPGRNLVLANAPLSKVAHDIPALKNDLAHPFPEPPTPVGTSTGPYDGSSAAPATGDGGWVIPTKAVMCESGGANLAPNSATASGYYQITDQTWAAYGGTTQHASDAPKSEQDAVASRLPLSAWDCITGKR